MFGIKKLFSSNKGAAPGTLTPERVQKINTIINDDSVIKGNVLKFKGVTKVLGNIECDELICEGILIASGQITASKLTVLEGSGTLIVTGFVNAEEVCVNDLIVLKSGFISTEVGLYNYLTVASGAIVKGTFSRLTQTGEHDESVS